MAKPAAPVDWATDATYATGPEVGDPPRLEPSSGFKAQGFIATEEAAARHINWALGALGDWTAYVDGLPTDADFVDEDFAWGGEHVFEGDVTFETLTTFDVGFLTTGFVATASDMGLGSGTNEVIYTTSLGVAAPRARQELLSLELGAPTNSNVTFGDIGLTFGGVDDVSVPIRLVRGAVITSVRYGFSNGSGGSVPVVAELRRRTADKGTGLVGTATEEADSWSASASTDSVRTITVSPNITIDNSASTYSFTCFADASCALGWVEINYLDPGPRNG